MELGRHRLCVYCVVVKGVNRRESTDRCFCWRSLTADAGIIETASHVPHRVLAELLATDQCYVVTRRFPACIELSPSCSSRDARLRAEFRNAHPSIKLQLLSYLLGSRIY